MSDPTPLWNRPETIEEGVRRLQHWSQHPLEQIRTCTCTCNTRWAEFHTLPEQDLRKLVGLVERALNFTCNDTRSAGLLLAITFTVGEYNLSFEEGGHLAIKLVNYWISPIPQEAHNE